MYNCCITVLVKVRVNAGNCNTKLLQILKKNTTTLIDCDRCPHIRIMKHEIMTCWWKSSKHNSWTVLYTYQWKHQYVRISLIWQTGCTEPNVYLLAFSIFITRVPHLQKNNDPIVYLHLQFKSEKFLADHRVCAVMCLCVCVVQLLAYIIAILPYLKTRGDTKYT